MRDKTGTDAKYLAIHGTPWHTISNRTDLSGKHVIQPPGFVLVDEGYSVSTIGDSFPALEHLAQAIEIARENGFTRIADAFA